MTRIIDSFTCGLEITICTRRAGEQEREESEGRGKGGKKHSLNCFFHSINLLQNILDWGLMAISCFAEC